MNEEAVIKEIKAIEDQRCQAILNCDYSTLESIVGEDLCYVHSSAVQENKQQYLAKLSSGHYIYKELKAIKREFRVIGDVVLVNGDLRITVEVAGIEKIVMSRYLQVWAKRNSGWQMVSWSSVPIPQ